MRRRLAVVVLTSVSLLLATTGNALASNTQRQVILRDACDGPSFNAAIGEGSCSRNGGVTFERLIDQLLSMGSAPAWRNAPGQLQSPAGGSIDARNEGGEFHTFTRVAAFGGGCVEEINLLLGLSPVPECANPSLFGTTGAPPGQSVNTGALAAGTHFFECLIHPWMRTTVTVS